MIEVEGLSIRAGSFELDGIGFTIPTGSYGLLMGRTGCGKTTILEAICGLKSVVSGSIRLFGEEVTELRPGSRDIGFVPQDGALFSTMTVHDHLAFALRIRRQKKAAVESRVEELAVSLGLTHLLHRKPHGLSGGERQRVALGRALSFDPRVLCLDEPLSALDEPTREDMCALLGRIQSQTGVTTLHITHNLSEARQLADKLFLLHHGKIEEASLDEEGISALLARFRDAPPGGELHRRGRSPDAEPGTRVAGGAK